MRQINLVVLDDSDTIVDRYNLEHITDINGLGYALKVSTISTEVEEYITRIVQSKRNISFTVIQTAKYRGQENLNAWLLENMNNTICLEYDNGIRKVYCEGTVIDNAYSELNQYKVLEQTITFKPLTPFFLKIENKVFIQVADEGKNYPFEYPYAYGQNVILNNEINNTYFKDIPVIISVYGTITNPHIILLDEQGNIYNEILFSNLFIDEGEHIVINSAQKKVWLYDGNGNKTDAYNLLNEAYDSYIKAAPLMTSSISINLSSEDSGFLIGSWRQYTL